MFSELFVSWGQDLSTEHEFRRLKQSHLPNFLPHLGNLLQDAMVLRTMNLAGSHRTSASLAKLHKGLGRAGRNSDPELQRLAKHIKYFEKYAAEYAKPIRDEHVAHIREGVERPSIRVRQSLRLAQLGDALATKLAALAGDTDVLDWPGGDLQSSSEIKDLLVRAETHPENRPRVLIEQEIDLRSTH